MNHVSATIMLNIMLLMMIIVPNRYQTLFLMIFSVAIELFEISATIMIVKLLLLLLPITGFLLRILGSIRNFAAITVPLLKIAATIIDLLL